MISVLIPFYNWDIADLLEDLLLSLQASMLIVEIIACDDCSSDSSVFDALRSKYNEEPVINVIRNDVNLGRSRTRNKLARQAQHQIIVFIDGDSRLKNPSTYLTSYAESLDVNQILIGGTAYDERPPDRDYLLHWRYGKNRESQPADIRNQEPIRYFFSNNFCCWKDAIVNQPFDEKLVGYGYEDSLLGQMMKNQGLHIVHINNNVTHKRLKSTHVFLDQASEAIATLAQIEVCRSKTSIKLLAFYRRFNSNRMGRLILRFLLKIDPYFIRLLKMKQGPLWAYDLHRLSLLSRYMQATKF